jgi:hypothetical protein
LFLILPLSFLVVRAEYGGLSTAVAKCAAFSRDDDFLIGVADVFIERDCDFLAMVEDAFERDGDFFKRDEFSLAARVSDVRGSAMVRSMRVLVSLSLVRSVASRAAISPLSVS